MLSGEIIGSSALSTFKRKLNYHPCYNRVYIQAPSIFFPLSSNVSNLTLSSSSFHANKISADRRRLLYNNCVYLKQSVMSAAQSAK